VSPSRKSTRKGETRSQPVPRVSVWPPLDLQLGTLFVAALLVVPPFLISRFARESFRQPKLYASGWLALASLLALVWVLRRVQRVGWTTLRGLPALSALLPFVSVATLGLALTRHPIQVREGLFDLWIGAACLVGWSAALPEKRLEQLLALLLIPASALALFGILQYHGLWRPFSFLGLAAGDRRAITSLAGNPGDLGAYLALPCLIGQWELKRRAGAVGWARDVRFWCFAAALVVCLYGLALTQTLAAIAAVGLGSLLFWVVWVAALPRRRRGLVLGLAGLASALALGLALGIAPLRGRIAEKIYLVRAGAWNEVFSGRFDGWQAALWMARENPWTGVGHGAYRPEFVPAKLALLDRGRSFSPHQAQIVFANAHSEPLEVAADLGLPGLAALAWGVWVLGRQLRRLGAERPVEERALAWAGVAALVVLSLAFFPFRVALVAFPTLFFLSWALRPLRPPVEKGGMKGRTLAGLLGVVLAAALLAQSGRWHDRMLASRVLRQVEALSQAAVAYGQAPVRLMEDNLRKLDQAAPLDPVSVDLVNWRGTQYLFLAQPENAIRVYREALALEPRAEIYLNLGRAEWLFSRRDDARRSFATAIRLDWRLANQLPQGAR
jgi:O-antigen ligase